MSSTIDFVAPRQCRRWPAGLLMAVSVLTAACSAGDSASSDSTTSVTPPADDGTAESQGSVESARSGEIVVSLSGDGGRADGVIEVTVTLENDTDDTVTLVRPTVIPNFVAFTVIGADGRLPNLGPQLRLAPLGADGFVELAGGESVDQTFDLTANYELAPGTYSISAEYRNPALGSHDGTRALVFEPGEGPRSEQIEIAVS